MKHSLNLAGNTLLPRRAARFCLEHAGVSADDVDCVAHYCEFRLEDMQERAARVGHGRSPADRARLVEAYEHVYETMLSEEQVAAQCERVLGVPPPRLARVRHHLAHAASAFYPSGFDEALVLTIDGSGEVESSTISVGRDREIEVLDRIHVPTSLGTLYLVVTAFLGFRTLGDEYKVMGLAGFGDRERYRPVFERLVPLADGGRYLTDGITDPSLREGLLDVLGPPRAPDEPIEQRHADVAAAVQAAVERAVLHTLDHWSEVTGLRRLCLAGGVALNCRMNGVIARSGIFDDVFVQPASGDDGGALGAALVASCELTGKRPHVERPPRCDLGPEYSDSDIDDALARRSGAVRVSRPPNLMDALAARLASGEVVGWFQGRMEFGPRALGHRSILADPRRAALRDRVNAVVKHRESFRPFAPAVLAERAHEYFALEPLSASPFMLVAAPVRAECRVLIPAVTHVDGSARVQTVAPDGSAPFRRLLEAFERRTGVPVLLNTSFNVMGEPIVCSPDDALDCFLGTDIDTLVLGDRIVQKEGIA